jgi:citrate synthase
MTDGTRFLSEPFTISDEHLNTGLRGFPVGTVRTSDVDPMEGVSYVGYPIADLADLPCENVVYLLLHKRLPTDAEAREFNADLARRAEVPGEVLDLLRRMPPSGHPMEWFIVGLHLLGMTGKTRNNDYREDALNLIARTSTIVAAIFRIKNGWGEPIPPRRDLSFHENFAHMLSPPKAHAALPDLLRLFYVLHMDHEGGNLSTFTGKAVASGLADVYSSMGAAMCALYGPLHGRANQECLEFVKMVGKSDVAEVTAFVTKHVTSGGKMPGFGHAVLRAEDPRAKIQYAYGREHFADHPLVATAIALREAVPPILKEHTRTKDPYPNVDAISGSLLSAAGLLDPEFYTVLFGWSRVAGISAQIVDERQVMRDGKGIPIYRPRYIAENQPKQRR